MTEGRDFTQRVKSLPHFPSQRCNIGHGPDLREGAGNVSQFMLQCNNQFGLRFQLLWKLKDNAC
jgi:hypothetical protein